MSLCNLVYKGNSFQANLVKINCEGKLDKAKVEFIKPSRSSFTPDKLNRQVIRQNQADRIDTNVILDNNVLVNMRRVVEKGNKSKLLKEHGLHSMVRLLNEGPSAMIGLSPAFAIQEMPETLAARSEANFHIFCAKHLRNYTDAPDSIPIKKEADEKIMASAYAELSDNGKFVYALPFASLLCLLYVSWQKIGSPADQYQAYLDLVENQLDVISAQEAEIARYCLAPASHKSIETNELCKILRRNFIKISDKKNPGDEQSFLKVAFNGACDITLVNAANVMDSLELDGVKQDTWIATQDKKLIRFCEIFHHLPSFNEAGKYALIEVPPEHDENKYWSETRVALLERLERRHSDVDLLKSDMAKILERTKGITSLVARLFDNIK